MAQQEAHRDTLTAPTRSAARTDVRVERVDMQSADSLATADSTASAQATDYSAAFPYPLFGTADSLRTHTRITTSFYREVPAEALFGTATVVVTPQPHPYPEAQSLTNNSVFQGFVLLLAAMYALLLYSNMDDIRTLFGRISHDPTKRLFEDSGSSFIHFLNIVSAIGMLFVGVIAIKYSDSLLPGDLLNTLSQGAMLLLSLLATAACIGWVIYQLIVMRIIGAVLLMQPFMSQLVMLKRTYFSLAVIVISPVLLLFALCPRGTGGVWFLVIVTELIITVILYLVATLNLFLSKKISILHWFLYLCTVEAFPISLLWLVATR